MWTISLVNMGGKHKQLKIAEKAVINFSSKLGGIIF